MLRVGLTGGPGSGKSTVASMLRERGAYVLSADDLARKLMEPGRPVFTAIVERFGSGILLPDGSLDRAALARIAFAGGQVDELNAIVHPATIALQEDIVREIARRDLNAIVVVESALIFETRFGGGWRERFDSIVLITASEALKIARFVARSGGANPVALEEEARRRLAQMLPDEQKAPDCDFILVNDGCPEELSIKVDCMWKKLSAR